MEISSRRLYTILNLTMLDELRKMQLLALRHAGTQTCGPAVSVQRSSQLT